MSAIGSAFPLLIRRAGGGSAASELTSRLCAVTQATLPQLQAQLQASTHAAYTANDDGVHCALSVGPDITVPITIVGTCEARGDEEYVGEDNVVVHSPGLPGGVVVARHELLHSRARVTPLSRTAPSTGRHAATPSLGSLTLLEAVHAHCGARPSAAGAPRGVLDEFYLRARRRHFSLAGMAHLLHSGSQLHPAALQLDFPYQCGGAQAAKRYLDITAAVTDVFGAPMRHGAKVLSRYGVAVSVGVADRAGSLTAPALLWHPSGAPAACLAPLLHGCALLPIGSVALDYNGPVPGSPLTVKEDPRRYMKFAAEGPYDDSVWLTEGLFGVKPGSQWSSTGASSHRSTGASPPEYEVLGVGYNEVAAEMELMVRDAATGAVLAAADV